MIVTKTLCVLGVLAITLTGSAAVAASQDVYETLPAASLTTVEIDDAPIPESIAPLESIPLRELLLEKAIEQVGTFQDCTDLVQNSLASLGLTTRRDQGGFDYGVQQLAVFGYPVHPSEALPGDIAITGPDNGGHVWIILDPNTGLGVHGGWNGGETVIGNGGVPISAHAVYRLPG